jgi:transcriptional regulator with XRE-family HTH domain
MGQVRETLGNNIKTLRENKGWTQATLAGNLGISPTFMMHIERGTRGVSIETIELLASVLEVNVSRLFETMDKDSHLADLVMPPGMQLEQDLRDDINKAITRYIERIKEKEAAAG